MRDHRGKKIRMGGAGNQSSRLAVKVSHNVTPEKRSN